ncbi:3-hydroxyisobutyryl-CoA hydrolase, mitochondrial [Mucor ambiguus]|uniref:3-hydroxyisobutyryl-CoA hydrolase n=1 Tax=Mucor ambiguus TaxID=91626 RepID=A0A0C9MGR5_9FUNG|nr:3-hydroxyisobutyryl-CoA hydrolase, mitochondrial [Mucor ambiguus]
MNRLIISVTNKHKTNAAGYLVSQSRNSGLPFSSLLTEKKNKSTIMTLNNPRFLNAASPEMVEMICSSLKEYERNSANIDMIFIRGAGNSLSAGGDLRVMAAGAQHPDKSDFLHKYLDHISKSLYRLKTLQVPKISLMDGLTVGYGGGLSFCSDYQVATENTVHMMPETRIGHFCDATSSYHLSRLKGNYGVYLALCAERSKAEDLIYSGMATNFIPSSRLDVMVHHLTSLDAPSTAQIKQEMGKFTEMLPSVDRLSTTPDISQSEKHAIVEHCFKYNTVGEILDALNEEGSRFSLAAKEKILLGSPSAAKLTLKLLREASHLSFKDCVLLERKLWTLQIGSHDLAEGCKSKLDKRLPVWYPLTHDESSFKSDVGTRYFDKVDSLPALNLTS